MSPLMSHQLKFTVIDNVSGNVVGTGSFYTFTSGSSLVATANMLLNTTETTYTIYIWLDEELYDNSTANSEFDINVRCTATMREITADNSSISPPYDYTAANYIKYMYDSRYKDSVTVNNITYNLVSSKYLMNDRHASMSTDINDGDVHYYGADPNNYVWLGDTFATDYSYSSGGQTMKKTAGSKKLWRIIGAFDGRLKLVSNDPISNTSLAWDTSVEGVNRGDGINQWGESTYSDTGDSYEGADLMRLLNPGYENDSVNNSLYWNKESGTVYSGRKNVTTSNISFANTGLSSDEKDMIDTAVWYVGFFEGNRGDGGFMDEHYNGERYDNIPRPTHSCGSDCNDNVVRTSTWEGKVGLVTVSDFGYATDWTLCSYQKMNFSTSRPDCYLNVWLRANLVSTISPGDGGVSNMNAFNSVWFYNYSYEKIQRFDASFPASASVFPSIYLKPQVIIVSGTGTEADPYVISLD